VSELALASASASAPEIALASERPPGSAPAPASELALERLIDRTLRQLPSRPAPPTLEARVLRELARRAALPWWRQSFAYWPSAARAVFASTCIALGGIALAAGGWAAGEVNALHASSALSAPSARPLLTLLGALGDLAVSLAHVVPAQWLYDGIAASVALYAALFGLAIAAYRTLYLSAPAEGRP
jgi:hypothetical protein